MRRSNRRFPFAQSVIIRGGGRRIIINKIYSFLFLGPAEQPGSPPNSPPSHREEYHQRAQKKNRADLTTTAHHPLHGPGRQAGRQSGMCGTDKIMLVITACCWNEFRFSSCCYRLASPPPLADNYIYIFTFGCLPLTHPSSFPNSPLPTYLYTLSPGQL